MRGRMNVAVAIEGAYLGMEDDVSIPPRLYTFSGTPAQRQPLQPPIPPAWTGHLQGSSRLTWEFSMLTSSNSEICRIIRSWQQIIAGFRSRVFLLQSSMSRASKLTLFGTSFTAIAIVVGVHYQQVYDKAVRGALLNPFPLVLSFSMYLGSTHIVRGLISQRLIIY